MIIRTVRKPTIAILAMLWALNAVADTPSSSPCSLQEIKDWVEKGRIFSVVAPHYPPIARGLGQKGRLLVNVTLDGERRIESAFLRYPSGHKELDEGVLDMVLGKTGTKLGAPVCAPEGQRFSFDIPLNFQFSDGRTIAKRELVLEYFRVVGAFDEVAAILSPKLTHMLYGALPEKDPRVSPVILEIIDEEVKKAVKREIGEGSAFFEKMIRLHQEHFSEDDTKDLIAFYRTSLGRRTARANHLVTIEMQSYSEQWGKGVMLLIADRINARFSERGLPYKLGPARPGTEAMPGTGQPPTYRRL